MGLLCPRDDLAHVEAPPPPPPPPEAAAEPLTDTETDTENQDTAAPGGGAPGPERALLIGINYVSQEGELRGCVNDVLDVWRFMVARGVECVILCDDDPDGGWPEGAPVQGEPTKEAIRREMASLAAWTRWNPRARCWFHYSGHGGQTIDWDGDEEDGKDECLFPVDYRAAGSLRDDEVAQILRHGLSQDASLVAIVDACHSGSMFDFKHVYSAGATEACDALPQHISISGCRDDQTSADARFGERWGGALTRALLPILQRGEARCGALRDELHRALRHFEQRPEVRGSSSLGSHSVIPNL